MLLNIFASFNLLIVILIGFLQSHNSKSSDVNYDLFFDFDNYNDVDFDDFVEFAGFYKV
jgi:hypothetical protein